MIEQTNFRNEMTYTIKRVPEFNGYLHYAQLGDKCWQQLMQTGAASDVFVRNANKAFDARKTN